MRSGGSAVAQGFGMAADSANHRVFGVLSVCCTAELSAQTKMLDETMQDTKKRVKLTIPQAGWQEFGISDKK